MATENDSTDESSEKSDWGFRPIKTVSIKQIEEAFSQALGQLTGKAYQVTITKLDLNPESNAWLWDRSNIELTLSNPRSDEKLPF